MIEVKGINKSYGKKHVLKDVSFTVQKGEVTVLIGINGVGKTTILNSIMNLTPTKKGQILIDGEPHSPDIYEKVAFIPDAAIMLPTMTVLEAMAFMQDYYDTWNPKRAKELLKFFKLNKDDQIQTLSKGNTAKLNLLMGMGLDVDYLLMDEPFSGIDVFTREEIANVFTTDLVAGKGVLITTHELIDIEHLIDHVVLLDEGAVSNDFYAEEMREKEGKSVEDVLREVYVR